jgi:GT2 family glycosyltransferase
LNGYRYDPFFKPEWSPDLSLSYMYTGHLGVYRRALVLELRGFRNAVSGAQDYDLLIRSSEMTSNILHIPKVLYHWRAVSGSAALSVEAKDWGLRACKRALDDAMQRRGIKGSTSDGLLTGIFHFKRDIIDSPSITIVAATTNDVTIRRGLFEETSQVEKILVVRDRRLLEDKILRNKSIHIIESASDSNVSAMCNLGAEAARGEHVLFLGEAVTPKGKDSVTALLEHSQRSEVGAVGGKIIDTNDKVIHAGYALGLRGIAGSPLMGRPAHHPGYFASLKVIRNCSAVSASFLMIKNALFRDVGGFDTRFRQAYYDLDLCLRLRTKGLLNVYTPYAEATVTARSVDREALDGNGHRYDAINFVRKWGPTLDDPDPYYSRNMSNAFDYVLKCRLFDMESSPSNDPSLLSLIETYSMRPDLQAAFPPSESSSMKKLLAWGITYLDEDSRNKLRKIAAQIHAQLPEAWFT